MRYLSDNNRWYELDRFERGFGFTNVKRYGSLRMMICPWCGVIWKKYQWGSWKCRDCHIAAELVHMKLDRDHSGEHPRYGGPKVYECCGEERTGPGGWVRELWCERCSDNAIRATRRHIRKARKRAIAHSKARKKEAQWLTKARKTYKQVRQLVRNQQQGVSSTHSQESETAKTSPT